MVSVGFRGGAATLEVALEETIKNLQGHLNGVQLKLRQIAQLCEADPEFKAEVELSDSLDDELREMMWLFDELRQMAYDLISEPETAEDKLFFKHHKAARKLDEKRLQKEHKDRVKADRVAQKAALKAEKATLGDVEEGEE